MVVGKKLRKGKKILCGILAALLAVVLLLVISVAVVAFNNVKAARTYNRFSWLYDTTKGTHKEMVLDKDDNDVVRYITDQPVTANPFVVNVTDMIHPNEIYIIYSFGGSDIIR